MARKRTAAALAGAAGLLVGIAVASRSYLSQPRPGHVTDEAAPSERANFPAPVEDYFHGMDGGLNLGLDEVRGRNVWMLWSAGNDRLWDWLARESGGEFDLLKIVSSYNPEKDRSVPEARRAPLKTQYPFRRGNRLETLGVLNEPCFDQPAGPDPRRHGLWLDSRQLGCRPDPFSSDAQYPGVAVGARGRSLPLGSLYGEATGVVGLRLFPNPEFQAEAAAQWDPVRYYTDPSYYLSRNLVRPYRVGVTCAFCHAGFNPAKPPADRADPLWENLSATAGAQYLRMDRVALWRADPSRFLWQLLHAARPGAMDPSLLATDHINNPRAIGGLFQVAARMQVARQWGREKLAGAALENRQMSTYVAGGPLAAFFEEPATVWTPRLGANAMESAGILAAVNRAFLETGVFSEEWLLHFQPLFAGRPDVPVDLPALRKNSAYWRATEQLTPDVVRFLMRITAPPRLEDAPGEQAAVLRGKSVFAERCASCHSSKFPVPPPAADPGNCTGDAAACWTRYQAWTRTPEFRGQMLQLVLAQDFLEGNSLSTDLRVPLPVVGSNACTALSPVGTAAGLWDAFTSQSYKLLPSAGTITYYHPVTGEKRELPLPAGGRGYLRPPSLVGLWASAPYLGNNSLGPFTADPGREARLAAFRDGIEQLLWPERRERDALLGERIPGRIDRTTASSTLTLPARLLPPEWKRLLEAPLSFLPGFSAPERIDLGPIPAGTPVSLLANLNLLSPKALPLLLRIKKELRHEPDFAQFVTPLFELSTCPDYIVNRGHYFGAGLDGESPLTDAQKRDLIEFLKTM